jgi:hypothetical protein
MSLANPRQHSTIVRGDGKIPPFVQRGVIKAGPFPVDLPASNRAAHKPHGIAVAMVCARVSVLREGPAELGEHDDDRFRVSGSEVAGERGHAFCERRQQARELAAYAPWFACVSHSLTANSG